VSALAGPLVVAASLLALAGAQKVVDPRHTTGALRALGLRVRDATVRAGAAVELAVGALVLTTGNRVAVAVLAASYLAFAALVEVARRRGTMVGSCGCFGSRDTPPSLVHVVVDVGLAGAAAAYVATASRPPLDGLSGTPGSGVPFIALAVVATGLVYVALTELPRLQAEVRRTTARRAGADTA
jgi:hypothetical protein